MTHEERVWHHEMETLEGIHEHAERIVTLEELCADLREMVGYLLARQPLLYPDKAAELAGLDRRMSELEVEP